MHTHDAAQNEIKRYRLLYAAATTEIQALRTQLQRVDMQLRAVLMTCELPQHDQVVPTTAPSIDLGRTTQQEGYIRFADNFSGKN